MVRIPLRLATLALATGTMPTPSGGSDLVYFARGGQAEVAAATIEGDRVRLDGPAGPRSFDRSAIRAVVAGDDPVRLWPARRAEADRDSTAGSTLAAALWGLENGLSSEAAALLRDHRDRIARSGPGPARDALAMVDALDAPCPDRTDLRAIVDRLRPSRFDRLDGDHVTLLHQGRPAEARRRLDLIERVVVAFAVEYRALGVAIRAPREKLVAACFADASAYADFLRRNGAGPFAETQGYYHPAFRAVFAHDGRATPAARAAARSLANRRREGSIDPDDADRLAFLAEAGRVDDDLGIAAHEAAHQLAIATGLAPRVDAFPPWLHEGIAARFEVVRGGRWAGAGATNDRRLPDWRAIRPSPRLAPLLRSDDFARAYRRDEYAEAWAFVHFLQATRPDRFRDFLDHLRTPDPPRPALAFRRTFGDDLPPLESAWIAHLAGLRTPLEATRPAPTLALDPIRCPGAR